ncbi:MAG: hypothetical protein ABUL44_02035, partial [Flavobacterium sp.]
MKNLLLISLLAFTVTGYDQKKEAAKELYPEEELRQDFDVFRTSLEEAHPGLYRFNSKAKMDSIFTAARTSINRPMTDREFMLIISRIVAQIGDGHMRVALPKEHKNKLDEGHTALPFRIYWYDDKLYVVKNYSPLTDKEFLGAQIISINGHTMTDFLSEYVTIVASDGSNVTNKYRMLQRPRFFPRYLNWLYGFTETYEVEYIPFG